MHCSWESDRVLLSRHALFPPMVFDFCWRLEDLQRTLPQGADGDPGCRADERSTRGDGHRDEAES